jgi:hypothetical protein
MVVNGYTWSRVPGTDVEVRALTDRPLALRYRHRDYDVSLRNVSSGCLMPRALCTCTTRGSDSFTVPAGFSSVILDVVGAESGHYFIAGDAAHGGSPAGSITGNPAGNGGEATGILPGLTPGQVLQVGQGQVVIEQGRVDPRSNSRWSAPLPAARHCSVRARRPSAGTPVGRGAGSGIRTALTPGNTHAGPVGRRRGRTPSAPPTRSSPAGSAPGLWELVGVIA